MSEWVQRVFLVATMGKELLLCDREMKKLLLW
jgi:hypothetical protein